jgi:hypothetical protein
MTTIYGGLTLACIAAYALFGQQLPDSVLLLFAAVIFAVHGGTERIIQRLSQDKETRHGRRRQIPERPRHRTDNAPM